MSGDDTSYAPKSPDLSSLYSAGPTRQSQSQKSRPLSQQSQQSRFSPQDVRLQPPPNTYFSGAPGSPQQARSQQHQHFPTSAPQALGHVRPLNAFGGIDYSQPTSQHYLPSGQTQTGGAGFGLQAPPLQQQYYPPTTYSGAQYYQQQYSIPRDLVQNQFHQYQGPLPTSAPASAPGPGSTSGYTTAPPPKGLEAQSDQLLQAQTGIMPPKRSARAAAAQQQAPEVDPSPVKTKFPTARIKRIMQADEEVGKVAQQTPIAVGKALEMFMIALVTKSADVARDKNSKRVSAQMLKQVVETDEQWDFLRDIVSKVENEEKAAKSGGRAKAAESESEEEVPVEKKKGKGPGRKKKA
ncbi:DNA polymerase epsilon subunit C [Diplogelasinospora grovesii]|uniref:NCT transcriptional regulatory complex subunit A n=1 Tax=Diplogelasinospora grovesii TaxID=303347 RepID=A0AAN6NBI9_9PEZI|nr:DNA polymerase epsilon subunit C [Diplogelasinospora grovesii]